MKDICWDMSGPEVETESFRIIEAEVGKVSMPASHWKVVRRLIHASGDSSLKNLVTFANNPIEAGLTGLEQGAPIYADSNMIRSGLSVPKLQNINPGYSRDHILCHVADEDVADQARHTGRTRALCALEKARPMLDDAIILIGNAPLALAGLARMILGGEVRPRLVIAMPVGFVNVLESKQMIMKTDVPQVVLVGRRGGSPLAVAALHGIMETRPDKASHSLE